MLRTGFGYYVNIPTLAVTPIFKMRHLVARQILQIHTVLLLL